MAVTVSALIARLSSAVSARTDLLYVYPLVLFALLLLPFFVPRRPSSVYSYCRRHKSPASSLLLSSCLLPCVFASQSLLTHAYEQVNERTLLAFYLASACSMLGHISLVLSPDLRILRRASTILLIIVLSVLPILVPRLHYHALQSLLTLVTLVYMAVLLTVLTSHLPHSFTLCELMVVCSILSLLLGHLTVVLGVSLLESPRLVYSNTAYVTTEFASSPALLVAEVLVALSVLLFLLPPQLICLPPATVNTVAATVPTTPLAPSPPSSSTLPSSSQTLNVRYILAALPLVALLVLYPLVWLLLRTEPVTFLVDFILHFDPSPPDFLALIPLPRYLPTHPRLLLSAYWLLVLGTFLPLSPSIAATTSSGPTWTRVPPIVVRKFYHLLATLIFLPALLLDDVFTCVAASLAFLLFLTIEYLRMNALQPFASHITAFVSQYLDSRDEGPLILTHLYLLVGCVLTGGLHSMLSDAPYRAQLAGVYVLGVMDAMASVVGCSMGRHSWEALVSRGTAAAGGGGKTVEGTVGGVVSVVVLHLCVMSMVGWRELSTWGLVRWCVATAAVGLMEAWTSQIDNLILPLYYYVVWLVAVADATLPAGLS